MVEEIEDEEECREAVQEYLVEATVCKKNILKYLKKINNNKKNNIYIYIFFYFLK